VKKKNSSAVDLSFLPNAPYESTFYLLLLSYFAANFSTQILCVYCVIVYGGTVCYQLSVSHLSLRFDKQ